MHWFNPITRTTSDQLRQALMLSTTARSKPWYRTVVRLSAGGFADGYGCEVAGILERYSAENEEGACEACRLSSLSRRGGKRPEHGPRLGLGPGATGGPGFATPTGKRGVCKLGVCGRTGGGVSESGRCKVGSRPCSSRLRSPGSPAAIRAKISS